MRIGNFEIFEDALDGAILAERAVKRIEDDIRLQSGKFFRDIARNVDARHFEAFLLRGHPRKPFPRTG
jgi:hypothetical protein